MLEVGKLSTAQTRRSDALIFGQRNVRFGCICADCCVWRHQNQGHMGRCWNHGSSGSVCLMPLSFLCCKSGIALLSNIGGGWGISGGNGFEGGGFFLDFLFEKGEGRRVGG